MQKKTINIDKLYFYIVSLLFPFSTDVIVQSTHFHNRYQWTDLSNFLSYFLMSISV